MLNLLKADLLRIVKDKLFLVLCIIFGAFGIVTPLFYLALAAISQVDGTSVKEVFSAAGIALSAFSPFTSIGLVLGIFMSILIYKDFSNGTIRNKIISGKSRLEIFLSHMLTTIIVVVGFVLAYVLLSFMVGSIFFNTGFTKENAGHLIGTFFLEILGWVVMALAITFFSMVLGNAGGAIVLYILIGIVLTSVGSILLSVETIISLMDNPNEGVIHFMDFINGINIPYAMSETLGGSLSLFVESTGDTEKFGWAFITEYTLSSLVFGSLFGFLGYLGFRNRDIK